MQKAHIFISYRTQEPDLSLATEFFREFEKAGHAPFLAGESIRLGDDWPNRIEEELNRCDYFLLLLSPKAITSDMVIEEVQRAKHLQESRPDRRPRILPVRVNFGLDEPLTYDLGGYLGRIQQRVWTDDKHTRPILDEILELIKTGEAYDDEDGESGTGHAIESERLDRPPLPAAPPELPEGQVDIASAFYVKRPNEQTEQGYYEEIEKGGALISIRAPRQMGKTSLMARILYHARQKGCLTFPITFQLVAGDRFANIDTLMRWFCSVVGRLLSLPNEIDKRWEDFIDPLTNAKLYFEEYILPGIDSPLVLGLDEVDRLFSYPAVSAEFLGVLRGWNEEAKVKDIWKKFRTIVVHSTESYVTLPINQSPFNVGLALRLKEFNAAQVKDLAVRHGLPWGDAEVGKLMDCVGGHPYLVRAALYYIARGETDLAGLLADAPTEEGKYSDHLRRHLWNLNANNLSLPMKRVVGARGAVKLDSMDAFKLEAMGLVERDANSVSVAYELYRNYFSERL